ncbi:MFS transporter [Anaerocolumna sp. MB42-C2]|uniref:MFS transporter n=1 Tax=Anaerocolumna sp. MB42-C2 TaxID=3070997 RepID=UPI0027DF5BAD|nr:MFS transporter [Anaerocolumna sp. MB42-C2]WMJ90127.1 MFS transporter [Anaerocolumna sp. MB42-C2]
MSKDKIWNRQFTILFMMNFILNISFYMVSTTLSKYLVALGMSVTVAGTIIGAMPMASMLIRPVSGWICDHFSKKKLLLLFLAVNCFCVAGYGMVQSDISYMALRILHGLSFGITTTAVVAYIAQFIPSKRMGEGLGYFGLTQTLAMAVGPFIGLVLSKKAGSIVMFYSAGFCVFLSLLSALFLDDQQPVKAAESLRLKAKDFFMKEVVIYCILTFTLSSVNGIESSYITLYGKQVGMEDIGWYFTLSAIILLFSRIWCGRLVDKKGLAAVLYPGIAAVVGALFLLSLVPEGNKALLFAAASVLKALGTGAIQPALQAAALQSVPSDRRGAATSTFYVGTDLGQASSPVIAAGLIDTKGYPFMFRIYVIPIFFAGVLYGLITKRKKKALSQR